MSASPGRLAMPRRRGTFSGLLILVLGVWGALVPFVGPYFDWTLGPDTAWDFSTTRLVMQAAPGVAAVVGGLLLMGAANRGSAILGALLTIAGGAWFAVGPTVSTISGVPDVGAPLAPGVEGMVQTLTLFTGLGALLCVLGGMALARVSARLEGDSDKLAAAAPLPASEPRAHQPQRDRAIAPARREDPAPADEAPTRTAPAAASEAPTRATPAAASEAPTRATPAAASEAPTRATPAAASEAPTRATPAADEAPTRATPAGDEARTRVTPTGGAGGDAGETRVLRERQSGDAAQTRRLGGDQPPPPDASDRRG